MNRAGAELDLCAVGLVCSLGADVVTASAALRAGISRPGPILSHPIVDLIEHEAKPLIGHPLSPLTDGFCSSGRWLQLLPLAFEDLLRQGELPDDPNYWLRTAVVVQLPDLDELRFENDERASLASLSPEFVRAIESRLPEGSARVLVNPGGPTSLARLLVDARAWMQQSQVERLVVLGVDSYVEPFSLGWLAESGRLKTDTNPVGLMPGEAAAALLFEPRGRRSSGVLAGVAGVTQLELDADSFEQAQVYGRLLADAMQPLLVEDALVLADLNGENVRAESYGYGWCALVERGAGGFELSTLIPELGDPGGVYAAAACVYAGFWLGQGKLGRRVVVVCGDETSIGCVALERKE